MAFQTRPRFILAVLGTVVVGSTLSCVGSGRRSYTRLGDDLIVSGAEERTAPDEQSVGLPSDKGGEGHIDVAFRAGCQDNKVQPDGARRQALTGPQERNGGLQTEIQAAASSVQD